jgi:16S rRNA (guanine527-N7)-methyltransferase
MQKSVGIDRLLFPMPLMPPPEAMDGLDQQAADHLLQRHVSRETRDRLTTIVAQLRKWQARINLVSPQSMDQVWNRHILDSLQLMAPVPMARRWIDLGSGGGFPGLVIAAVLAEFSEARITLVESNGKKCAFLRETVRLAALPAEIVHARIEDVVPGLKDLFDVVSARALAPLAVLLEMAEPLLQRGSVGIFPKGQDVDDELRDATKSWNMDYDLIQSQTEPDARIVVVRQASKKD